MPELTDSGALLSVRDLKVHFPTRAGVLQRVVGHVKAVDGISFEVPRGTTVGLVGESGSGKTTTGRAIARLAPITAGSVCYAGQDLATVSKSAYFPYRKKIQMIFQDPFSSLNPRMTVYSSVAEPLEIHFKHLSKSDKEQRVAQLLTKVGLDPDFMRRYPHQFSGGQRQRIGIARALAVEPEFIICDEPVSALDVSVQAQIVNLLQDLQEELGLTYLFIAHDLAVVEHISDSVLVMTEGKIVEQASAEAIYSDPQHPYTKKLLAAVPSL
jgi:peptide/nickel transport system ATP-binding protein/oligopeptide transport system ATP-binding protein